MKFYNKVDLELLKDKISLEALEENIATLTKDNAIKDIKIDNKRKCAYECCLYHCPDDSVYTVFVFLCPGIPYL